MELGNGIQKSIDLYLKNFGLLFVAGLLVLILSAVTLGILAGPLVAGYIVLVQKLSRGEQGETNEIFAHFDKFIPTLIIGIIIMVISLIFCIIPIINFIFLIVAMPAISLIYISAIGFIVNHNMEPLDALKRGYECFMTNPGMNWLFCFIINILSSIGAVACGIGVILTFPISYIGMTIAYQELSQKVDNPAGPSVQA